MSCNKLSSFYLHIFQIREKNMAFYERRDKNAAFGAFPLFLYFAFGDDNSLRNGESSSFGHASNLTLNLLKERTTKMLENKFQSKLIKEIKETFPGCIVMKNDSSYIQGIPDLLILHKEKWGSLEVKKDSKASKQPNQEYYVGKMDEMSFSKFIYPENKDEVLEEMKRHFN